MDLQQAYYEQKFENLFRQAKGNGFQDFFEKLMGLAHKGDFMPCRPWGKRGDRKNDGFLKSERRLFQAYAPNEMTERVAIKKIREDFEGAKLYWGVHFDKWAFVHNAAEGLPPHVHKVLLDLEKENPGIKLDPWSLEELRVVFRRLELDDKESWLGFAPTAETRANLGFEDLRMVLETLSGLPPPPNQEVRDVPRRKIEANALSDSVSTLLKEGMVKAPLVESFLDNWHDATLGERIAQSFKAKYESLHDEGLAPNLVFAELQSWAGGESRGAPEHELAVLTIMAYYFHTCDIFEELRGNGS